MCSRLKRCLILLPVLLVSGCGTLLPRAESATQPAPVVDMNESGAAAGDGPVLQPLDPAAKAPVSGNRATKTLVAQADRLQAKGELEASAAALERALRIEPRNARLWHRLASIRLAQGQHQLAASMAAKSNSLAGNDQQLVEMNNEIIRDARLGN